MLVVFWAAATYLATQPDLRYTSLQTVVDLHHGCVGQGWLQPVSHYLACRFDGSLRQHDRFICGLIVARVMGRPPCSTACARCGGAGALVPGGSLVHAPCNQHTVNIPSAYSQRTVNIQSTYSQHTVNIQST